MNLEKKFVEECLERQEDPAAVILDLASGKSARESLLNRIDREELVKWLTDEIDALIEDGRYNSTTAHSLLAHLQETKTASPSGIEVKVERCDLPEQMDLPMSEGYVQEFEATILFEGIELGGCYVYANGEYKEGEWVGESVEWPEGLKGLIDLPEVMIDEPEEELTEETEEQPEDMRTVESRERDLSEEMRRGRAVTRDNAPESSDAPRRPIQSPELPGLGR